MASIKSAPAALQQQHAQAKAYLRANFKYLQMYSSYSARTGKVRIKLYGLYRLGGPLSVATLAALGALGFAVRTAFGRSSATLHFTAAGVVWPVPAKPKGPRTLAQRGMVPKARPCHSGTGAMRCICGGTGVLPAGM